MKLNFHLIKEKVQDQNQSIKTLFHSNLLQFQYKINMDQLNILLKNLI